MSLLWPVVSEKIEDANQTETVVADKRIYAMYLEVDFVVPRDFPVYQLGSGCQFSSTSIKKQSARIPPFFIVLGDVQLRQSSSNELLKH